MTNAISTGTLERVNHMVAHEVDPEDDAHRARRRVRAVSEGLTNVDLSGLPVFSETVAEAAEYVDGRIGLDEWGRRVRARYGVPPDHPDA